ncbi:fimbrial protein [Enterobacter cloacae]|uniref:fimbrial protein n=1 Tax=Enterobacter cloacae TaxID=550 RepID=UPI00345C788D
MNKKYMATMLLLCSTSAFAEPDNTCWGDPINIAVVDIGAANFDSNKKGGRAKIKYSTRPSQFSGRCNRSADVESPYHMTHYIDMGKTLMASTLNPGHYKLSEDVDVRISSSGSNNKKVYFPAKPEDGLYGTAVPPKGQDIFFSGFAVAGNGDIELILRRDVIGGALIVPPDAELFSAYRVINIIPYPQKASRPLVQARTKPGGGVIPIPPECSINKGKTIEIDFGTMMTNLVTENTAGSEYSKTVPLSVSCNTSLTQDILITLVSDTSPFSSDLIRSTNEGLGIALKHNNRLVKPHTAFPSRIVNGSGSETIHVSPVKNGASELKGGKFTASATLVITSL